MRLLPSHIENRKALSAALLPALKLFIAAEHQEDAKGKVQVTLDRHRPGASEINARWRAA
jgi:hypothetical protein